MSERRQTQNSLVCVLKQKSELSSGFSRCENIAGFHGIRDNPVIPWNLENPCTVQTDPVEMFAIPIPELFLRFRSRNFFKDPDPVQSTVAP